MKYFVIFLILIGSMMSVFAFEPSPVGVTIINYGIFDPNDNNTHVLKVGEKYNIKVYFKSDLDEPVSFTYFIQVLDKDKHWSKPIGKFNTSGILEPEEHKFFSFTWIPEYAGKFRTFSEVSDDSKNTTIGGVPQFDFQVIQPDIEDPNHDYFPTYRIMNLNDEYLVGESIKPYVLKKDLNGCNAYRAKIITEDTRQQVWEYQFSSSCVVLDTLPEVESKIPIPFNQESIIFDELGDYVLEIDMGNYEIQKRFSVVGMQETSKSINSHSLELDISPLKQFQMGIKAENIHCKDNFQHVIKNDGTPACVTKDTSYKLIERGWARLLITHFPFTE